MSDQIDRARRDAEAARSRLMGDVHQLQDRLSPANLAEEAIEGVKAKGLLAVAIARRNPIAASAGAAGLLLLLARKPIAGLIRRWRNHDEQD